MKLNIKLAASLLLAGDVSMAQATSYNVNAVFRDGGVQGQTVFTGSFDWDGITVSNFNGLLSESMWRWNTSNNLDNPYFANLYNPSAYANGDAPLLNLSYQLAGGGVDPNTGLVTVTTFLQNSTDVVWGGGYDVKAMSVMADGSLVNIGGLAYGTTYPVFGWDGNARNNNGFFTLVFDPNDPTNTTATWNQMIYGDYTALGMMGPMLTGPVGMSGWMTENNIAGGTMGGMPLSLAITAAVPVPAAAWLFGGALMTLFGTYRNGGRSARIA